MHAPRKLTSPEEVIEAYVERVKAIPAVREVRLLGGDLEEPGPTVWTVIAAPPFDFEARRPMYEAEAEILRAAGGPLVGFRLVNLEELRPGVLETLFAPSDKVLWRRQ